jgi:hypothetical protein
MRGSVERQLGRPSRPIKKTKVARLALATFVPVREAHVRIVCAALASLLFLGLGAYEVHHDLIRQVRWTGYGLIANNVAYLLGALWLVGAVGVWIRRDVAWLAILPGILATFAHGLVVAIGGSERIGGGFLAAAVALLLLTITARRPVPTDALAGPQVPGVIEPEPTTRLPGPGARPTIVTGEHARSR